MTDEHVARVDRLYKLLDRTYKLLVGHGLDNEVFESYEEALDAYEAQERDQVAWPRPRKTLYAVRIHDLNTEDDPSLATVMYARDVGGPWHDMVTGHTDWAWEVCGALEWVEDLKAADRERESARRL